MSKISGMAKSEKGSALIVFALCMTVVMAFSALVIDVGMISYQKSMLSKAVDAAALAGAQELINNRGNACNVVDQYLEKNGVDPLNADITIFDSDTKISVTASKDVNYCFARILGFDKANVKATGVAKYAPVVGIYAGIRPFAIENQTLDFDQTYTIKEGGGDGSNGNYGALALSGNGASTYVDNIVSGYEGHLKVGDYVETEPGNMSGPTAEGIETLINHCTHIPECTPEHYAPDCPRIITVIMVDTLDVNGSKTVRIVGFAKFFLLGVAGEGQDSVVTGKFIKMITTGDLGDSQADFGLEGVKLIQ